MKIRVFRNLGAELPPFREGEVCTVSDEIGRTLVESGLAEEILEPAPRGKLRGVPKVELQATEIKDVEG